VDKTKNQINNNTNKKTSLWRPVIIFYAKTTAWVILPLFLALLLGKYIQTSINSQLIFFIVILGGFLVTCYGIYKEIRIYKKDLESSSKQKKTDGK
jgi:hypothetical protein